MLITLFIYSAHLNNKLYNQSFINALDNIQTAMESTVSATKDRTFSLSRTADFIFFSNSSNQKRVSEMADSLEEEGRKILFASTEVVGLYLYNTKCEYEHALYKNYDIANKRDTVFATIKEYATHTTVYSDTTLSAKHLDGKPYLLFIMKERYGILAVLIDPSKNLALANYNALGGESQRYIVTDSPVHQSQKEPFLCREIDSLGLYLHLVLDDIHHYNSTQILLIVIIILLLLLIPILLFLLQRLITRPLKEISTSLDTISSGDLDHRLAIPNAIDDVSKFAANINQMLDKIHQYQEDSFSNRMDAMQAKLQYLQLQIHPHFYLNCMKSLNSYLYLKDCDNAQKLVMALSNYIVHAFRDVKNYITIREELESVQSYVDLCNMLSYTIHLEFQLLGNCMNANCLPMMILNFVENSIKHSATPNDIKINILVENITQEYGEDYLRIIIKNSGGHFPDNVLQEMDSMDASQMVYRTRQIGITNVRFRLWLIYGDAANLSLRNEDSNAVVEILLPNEPHHERII